MLTYQYYLKPCAILISNQITAGRTTGCISIIKIRLNEAVIELAEFLKHHNPSQTLKIHINHHVKAI